MDGVTFSRMMAHPVFQYVPNYEHAFKCSRMPSPATSIVAKTKSPLYNGKRLSVITPLYPKYTFHLIHPVSATEISLKHVLFICKNNLHCCAVSASGFNRGICQPQHPTYLSINTAANGCWKQSKLWHLFTSRLFCKVCTRRGQAQQSMVVFVSSSARTSIKIPLTLHYN